MTKKKNKKTSIHPAIIDIINNNMSLIDLKILSNNTNCTLWPKQRTKNNLQAHVKRALSEKQYSHREIVIDYIIENYPHELVPNLSNNGIDYICEEHAKFEIIRRYFKGIEKYDDLFSDEFRDNLTVASETALNALDDLIDHAVILNTDNIDSGHFESYFPVLKKDVDAHVEKNLPSYITKMIRVEKIEKLKKKITA